MLAPRGTPPKSENKEKSAENQFFYVLIADLRSWGRELSIPGGGFPIRAFLGTENFGDTHPAIFCPNPHPYSGLPLLRAACHAIQPTDRRPGLRSKLVILCQSPSRVPILTFSIFLARLKMCRGQVKFRLLAVPGQYVHKIPIKRNTSAMI